VYIFWTKEESSFSPVSFLSKPDPADVKALIESPVTSRERTTLKEEAFFATAFSASGGRVVVRDYLETTVHHAQENLRRWFRLQKLVGGDGSEGTPAGIYALSSSIYRDANKEMRPEIPRALLEVALNGGPLPDWLLYQAVRRNRAGQGVTRTRLMLIKMVFLSKDGSITKENSMEQLELSNRDPAYLCGRLLTVLEQIQKQAIPGISATIIDRYFGTASSAPATVFGHLMRGAQAHLAKLRKTKEGAFYGLQKRLEEILKSLGEFPGTLTLKEQALFSLGYYHKRAFDRGAAREAKERKQQNK
jgi:CRISPR-associated protein Csd1